MYHQITLNDKAIIEEALRRMHSGEPTVPAEKVRQLMMKFGEEIQRTGELRPEVVDRLVQQLHDGVL